jgi:hypothetical protein
MKYDVAIEQLRLMARACGDLAQQHLEDMNKMFERQGAYIKAIELLEEFNDA